MAISSPKLSTLRSSVPGRRRTQSWCPQSQPSWSQPRLFWCDPQWYSWTRPPQPQREGGHVWWFPEGPCCTGQAILACGWERWWSISNTNKLICHYIFYYYRIILFQLFNYSAVLQVHHGISYYSIISLFYYSDFLVNMSLEYHSILLLYHTSLSS